MLGPLVTLAAFVSLLALCGVLGAWKGWDSRDGFTDQAHRAPRRQRANPGSRLS